MLRATVCSTLDGQLALPPRARTWRRSRATLRFSWVGCINSFGSLVTMVIKKHLAAAASKVSPPGVQPDTHLPGGFGLTSWTSTVSEESQCLCGDLGAQRGVEGQCWMLEALGLVLIKP